jgi:hypothetical protein
LFVATLPMRAAFGAEMDPFSKTQERVESLIDRQDHVTALAAMSAVRTAVWNELFPAEAGAAIAACAGLNQDFRFVEEHGFVTHGDPAYLI